MAHPLGSSRPLSAAQLQGSRNRLTLSPELVRRAAELGGYGTYSAASSEFMDVADVTDIIELMLMVQMGTLDIDVSAERRVETERARDILGRIVAGRTLTRREVHDALPSRTVVLFRMGPPRLWGYAVEQRLPADAKDFAPSAIKDDPTGPFTDATEAWLGWHITDASHVDRLETHTDRFDGDPTAEDNDRYQRLRLGMSLADPVGQVWSSARGHWSIKPETEYIVPSRYGWCPYVFRIPEGGWRRDSFEGHRDRFMATRGLWIDIANDRLVEMGAPDKNNAWRPTMTVSDQPLTDTDRQVATLLTDEVIALGPAGKNPIIRLRQRGRRLY